ncbi:collagen alpha-1(VII) chain-like [Littorina saxatilis]|uniref:collagen alpha-1(VII) chain-like n=1 Tax=Littorina saxatilis TaxID=31220 RepID=UPI0038B641E8
MQLMWHALSVGNVEAALDLLELRDKHAPTPLLSPLPPALLRAVLVACCQAGHVEKAESLFELLMEQKVYNAARLSHHPYLVPFSTMLTPAEMRLCLVDRLRELYHKLCIKVNNGETLQILDRGFAIQICPEHDVQSLSMPFLALAPRSVEQATHVLVDIMAEMTPPLRSQFSQGLKLLVVDPVSLVLYLKHYDSMYLEQGLAWGDEDSLLPKEKQDSPAASPTVKSIANPLVQGSPRPVRQEMSAPLGHVEPVLPFAGRPALEEFSPSVVGKTVLSSAWQQPQAWEMQRIALTDTTLVSSLDGQQSLNSDTQQMLASEKRTGWQQTNNRDAEETIVSAGATPGVAPSLQQNWKRRRSPPIVRESTTQGRQQPGHLVGRQLSSPAGEASPRQRSVDAVERQISDPVSHASLWSQSQISEDQQTPVSESVPSFARRNQGQEPDTGTRSGGGGQPPDGMKRRLSAPRPRYSGILEQEEADPEQPHRKTLLPSPKMLMPPPAVPQVPLLPEIPVQNQHSGSFASASVEPGHIHKWPPVPLFAESSPKRPRPVPPMRPFEERAGPSEDTGPPGSRRGQPPAPTHRWSGNDSLQERPGFDPEGEQWERQPEDQGPRRPPMRPFEERAGPSEDTGPPGSRRGQPPAPTHRWSGNDSVQERPGFDPEGEHWERQPEDQGPRRPPMRPFEERAGPSVDTGPPGSRRGQPPAPTHRWSGNDSLQERPGFDPEGEHWERQPEDQGPRRPPMRPFEERAGPSEDTGPPGSRRGQPPAPTHRWSGNDSVQERPGFDPEGKHWERQPEDQGPRRPPMRPFEERAGPSEDTGPPGSRRGQPPAPTHRWSGNDSLQERPGFDPEGEHWERQPEDQGPRRPPGRHFQGRGQRRPFRPQPRGQGMRGRPASANFEQRPHPQNRPNENRWLAKPGQNSHGWDRARERQAAGNPPESWPFRKPAPRGHREHSGPPPESFRQPSESGQHRRPGRFPGRYQQPRRPYGRSRPDSFRSPQSERFSGDEPEYFRGPQPDYACVPEPDAFAGPWEDHFENS